MTTRPSQKPWLLFTDGALEYDADQHSSATIGAVLISPGGEAHCFGCAVPSDTVKMWQVAGREHVMGLVELYACVTALETWRDLISEQRVILFVDNYGAQDCLIKGTASVDTWRQLLMKLEMIDDSLFANMWVTRVASSSNPSDFPSRGSLKEIEFLGPLKKCTPCCPLLGKALALIC